VQQPLAQPTVRYLTYRLLRTVLRHENRRPSRS